ncbi:ABC transporter permease [Tateyamaria sp.]|uniref:ABC transporter permease n=1 Tax=Tateyamaria sp. TaxID=1929288 RepID=UPI00329ECD4C
MPPSDTTSSSDPLSSAPVAPPLRPKLRRSTLRTVAALMLREMATRYGAKPGGYAWAIFEPLGTLFILSLAFSLLLRSPSLGESFILFYATGYLPFNLFNGTAGMLTAAIAFSKSLLKYPAVGWIDALLARFILNALTLLLISYVLLVAILWFTGTRTVIDMPPVIGAFVMAMALGFGIGTFNCAMRGLFPVYGTVWTMLTRPLLIVSAVLYIMEDLPNGAQQVLWYNPLAHITGLARTGFYPVYNPDYINPAYVMAWALIPMAMGLLLLRKHHLAILNR